MAKDLNVDFYQLKATPSRYFEKLTCSFMVSKLHKKGYDFSTFSQNNKQQYLMIGHALNDTFQSVRVIKVEELDIKCW